MSPRGRPDDQHERAERILDAAAGLLLRYGYDKTRVEDVAAAAGVAKGSVYRHWSSRESLFLALLRREKVGLLAEVRDTVAAAGEPADMRLLLELTLRAYQRQPVLTAVLKRDLSVLGGLARTAEAEGSPHGRIVELMGTLRAGGWIRTDQTLAEQVTVLSSVFLGYFVTAPLMPPPFRIPEADAPALIAETVHRALARTEPLSAAEVAAVDRATQDFITEAAAAARDEDAP